MKADKLKTDLLLMAENSRAIRWALLIITLFLFSMLSYPGLITVQPHYGIGDVAERDIKTPVDLLIEDQEATRAKDAEALAAVQTVYDHNTALLDNLTRQVYDAFQLIGEPSGTAPAGPPPGSGMAGKKLPDSGTDSAASTHSDPGSSIQSAFERDLSITVNKSAFDLLKRTDAHDRIADAVAAVLSAILKNGVVANRELLLREAGNGIILRDVATGEEMLVRQVEAFYGVDQAKTAVSRTARGMIRHFDYPTFSLIVDITQQLIQPNITLNRNETEARKRAAAESVKPVFYRIKAGEMLLREGERVTQKQLLKLDALHAQTNMDQEYPRLAGALIMIGIMLLAAYRLLDRHKGRIPLASNKTVLFLLTLLTFTLIMARASYVVLEALINALPQIAPHPVIFLGVPLAGGAMAVSLFMGFRIALCFAIVLATATTFIFQGQILALLYFLINGILSAYWLQNCRERKVFIRAGIQIGLLNTLLALGVTAYGGSLSFLDILINCCLGFIGGMVSGIITAGLVPLLELIFGYTTDISLLELANLERPILKQLLMEAPGTYHHSMIVGSMVEAAAAEIDANPLLARVCGYYHDIGKIRKPLYFIENQSRGVNRHDKLAPSMSGLILISHIKEGVEIARKHKLGQDIIDAIRQHHGTSLIRYFYEKAKRQKGADAVNMENYRYPGPKPQTREIALVMLADVLEAASRTLDNPTPSRIKGLVRDLINQIFADGQLNNCEITLHDLHKIGACYTKILNGIHHHRIEYPEKNGKEKTAKDKNGRTDQQSAKPKRPADSGDREDGATPIRRLGVS